MDKKNNTKEPVWIEHINDICGGYIIAHKGDIEALVRNYESPLDAIKRVQNECSKDG